MAQAINKTPHAAGEGHPRGRPLAADGPLDQGSHVHGIARIGFRVFLRELGGNALHVGLGGVKGGAGSEPANGIKSGMVTAIHVQIRDEPERRPHVRVWNRGAEAGRHHSDHRVDLAAEIELLIERRGRAAERAVGERLAQQHRRHGAGLVVRRAKPATRPPARSPAWATGRGSTARPAGAPSPGRRPS